MLMPLGTKLRFLRVVGTNNHADAKVYAKSCCHKTIILMTSIHLLKASGAPAAKCGLHNSIKLRPVFTGIGL